MTNQEMLKTAMIQSAEDIGCAWKEFLTRTSKYLRMVSGVSESDSALLGSERCRETLTIYPIGYIVGI